MFKEIKYRGQLLAIIIKRKYQKEGISFFTPNEFSQQLAYMKHGQGHKISPHVHKKVPRRVVYTQEVLFIKSGQVKVDLYTQKRKYLESFILNAGDVILLAYGGHGFTMLKPSEIIEVKQGPYVGQEDKVRFEGK